MSRAPISFHDLHPTADDLAAHVLAGFARAQRSIPPWVSRATTFAWPHRRSLSNSPEYSVAEFRDLAKRAGFTTDTVWVDADRLFSLHLPQTGIAHAT